MTTAKTTTHRRKTAIEHFDVAVRFAASDDAGTFSGYGAVFGEPNSFGEIVKRGAFARTLREHRARKTKPGLFWMHNPTEPIGVWEDIVEDEKGLRVDGKLVLETVRGAEAHALMKAGALDGLSIGFRARKDERGPNGVRVLTDIELVEISIVSLPAAMKARVDSVRSGTAQAGAAAFIRACRSAAQSILGKA